MLSVVLTARHSTMSVLPKRGETREPVGLATKRAWESRESPIAFDGG